VSDFPDLPLKIGSYPCTVLHPTGQRLAGQLELHAEQRPHGEIFAWPHELQSAMNFPQPTEKFATLKCELQTGYEVLLLNVSVEVWFPGRATFKADAAVVGLDLSTDPESCFREVSLQITNGHRVFGPTPIRQTAGPTSLPKTGTYDYRATLSVDADKSYVRGSIELRCRYWHSSHRGDYYRFDVQTAPVFEARSDDLLTGGQWIERHVLPLRELVTLATLQPQTISWLTLEPDGDSRVGSRQQVFSSAIAQAPYAPTRDALNDARALFVFSDLPYSPVELLERWELLRSTHHNFIGPLMQGVTTPRMDFRSRFLALVQALEGLHTQVYGEGPLPEEEHRRQLEGILNEVKRLGLAKDGRIYLRRWLDWSGRYSLRERLKELRDVVADEISSLPELDLDLVPGDVSVYRNKISHGADSYPLEVLRPINRVLSALGVAHVLRLLELPLNRMTNVFT